MIERNEAMEDIRAAIAWYDERGADWLDAVTYIGIRACFGGWFELINFTRYPHPRPGRPRKV